MRLETLLGAGVGLLLRAVYMDQVFAPYPAARYVDTAPLVVLGALAAAILMELILQLFSHKRRRTRLRERAFGVSLFFSAAIFIEFGKMANEFSGGAEVAAWAAAFVSPLLLSNLLARYCRYERLSTRQAAHVMATSARRAAPIKARVKAKTGRRAALIKPRAKSARRSSPIKARAKPAPRPRKPKVAPSPSWQYHERGKLLYRGWNHRSKRRRDSAASRKRAYAYGRRQPARAV